MMSLEALSTKYLETNDDTLLPEILESAQISVRSWISYNSLYKSSELPDYFVISVALDYIARLKSKQYYTSTKWNNIIRDLARETAKKFVSARIYSEIKSYATYDPHIDDRLIIKEKLVASLRGLPVKLRALVLFYYHHGDVVLVRNTKEYLTKQEYVILTHKVLDMNDDITTILDSDAYMPRSSSGQIMLISALLSKNPDMASLLLMMKDLKKFIQFLILNSETTIKVPKAVDYIGEIIDTSKSIKRMEEGGTVMNDLEMFKNLVIESDPEHEIVEKLSEFIHLSFAEITANYERLIQLTLEKLDKYGTTEDIKTIYETLNNQLVAQYNLLKSISYLGMQQVTETLNHFKECSEEDEKIDEIDPS